MEWFEIIEKKRKMMPELLKNLFEEVTALYPKEWLLFIEIIELSNDAKSKSVD